MKTQKYKILLLFSFVLWGACTKNTPQRPTTYSQDEFIDASKEINKQIREEEKDYFAEYMQEHSHQKFVPTQAGFYMTKTIMDKDKITQDKDTVSYIYQVIDLQGNTIYSEKEIGIKTEVMGQSPILPGIEYGLKRMQQGEQAILLLPSALAYGNNGDGNKIGNNLPIIVTMNLLKNRNR